ncbi:NAD+ synthase [Magnetococcales bacterium HHB-1]
MEFTLALLQMNAHVGDLEKNCEKMLHLAQEAKKKGADLLAFPELALTGYPPEDLLLKPLFLERLGEVKQRLTSELGEIGIDAVYGAPKQDQGRLFNAGILVRDGCEEGFFAKWKLPNYGVFDERRYFYPGGGIPIFDYKGIPFGITVCEDIWHPGGAPSALSEAGARWLLNLNASPYHRGKAHERKEIVAARIREIDKPIVYVNLVGGQDELVFDGGSFVMNRDKTLAGRGAFFREDILYFKVALVNDAVQFKALPPPERSTTPEACSVIPMQNSTPIEEIGEVYAALCLGLRDYVQKNGFQGVVLGLSGGIDSALTAAICVDALGADRVEGLMMPSPYTSKESLDDAKENAARLKIHLSNIPIGPLFDHFKSSLESRFAGCDEDVTEENIQPRIRATLLMAISNKKGLLLVTTGNKSEVSVGYATLYGDMAGGYSVLKDVLKQSVYQLAEARNRWARARGEPEPIPEHILTKAPSAELKPDQKDSDSLPPYEILDKILQYYVEEEMGLRDIVALGIDPEIAAKVISMVDRNEYKRRQAPPGVRITKRAFGKDRRYPITNGFAVVWPE